MDERVVHDVGDVMVREAVANFLTDSGADHEFGGAKYLEMLRHGWLRGAERLDEFVHAAVFVGRQLFDDLQPERVGERAQQLGGAFCSPDRRHLVMIAGMRRSTKSANGPWQTERTRVLVRFDHVGQNESWQL